MDKMVSRLYMHSVISLILLLLHQITGRWQVDPRCPDPPNRRLEEQPPTGGPVDDILHQIDDGSKSNNTTAISSLRHRILRPSEFRLKMYWQRGYCWQEEYDIHRKWCWGCHGDGCGDGDRVYIQFCRSDRSTQLWKYEDDPRRDGGKLKPATNTNICMERTSTNGFHLKPCRDTERQTFVGFNWDQPFELKPHARLDKCLNQAHHPKAGEVVETTDCSLARYDKTNEWVVYDPSNMEADAVLTTANNKGDGTSVHYKGECSNRNKCGRCEGDCDGDSNCEGNLVCYQRRGREPVPGCSGSAQHGRDYCIDKAQEQIVSFGSGAVFYKGECTRGNKCGKCQGDCDRDSHCENNLVCLQRLGNEPVPGCDGRPDHARDYCVDPRQVGTSPLPSSKQLRYVRECNRNNPCGICEGDCDSNSGCEGNMICYHLTAPGSVPGCRGYDTSKTDFCIPP